MIKNTPTDEDYDELRAALGHAVTAGLIDAHLVVSVLGRALAVLDALDDTDRIHAYQAMQVALIELART